MKKGICRIWKQRCLQDTGDFTCRYSRCRSKAAVLYHASGAEQRTDVVSAQDSTKAVIRRVMTKEEANRLIHDIPSIKKLEVPNEKQREASYKQALQGCSGRDWISILKTLNQRKEETAGGRQENNRTG